MTTMPTFGLTNGHVAYVEKVDGNYVYISEANWDNNVYGPDSDTDGTVRAFLKTNMSRNKTFLGYIYPK